LSFFPFTDPAPTTLYTLSLHDALPIFGAAYYYLPLHQFIADNQNGTFTFSASDRDFNAADPRTYPDRFSIRVPAAADLYVKGKEDRKSTRLNSSHRTISYAVFCLKKKK